MFSAIFLDRDGVLIENRDDYVRDWSQVSVIPEAIEALTNPKLDGYKMVVVTNQSAVGRGIITLESAEEINRRLLDLIQKSGGRLDGIYLCPHEPADGCDCRKPMPGLLIRAAQDLSLDLKLSWMIGDAWSDVQAGQAAGTRAIILKTGRGLEQLALTPPADMGKCLVCENLPQALQTILAWNGQN